MTSNFIFYYNKFTFFLLKLRNSLAFCFMSFYCYLIFLLAFVQVALFLFCFETALVFAIPFCRINGWRCRMIIAFSCVFCLSFIFFLLYQTRVQASTLSFPELISKLPEIGIHGLYRGSVPAILGQFSR